MKKQKKSRRYEADEVKRHMSVLAEDFQSRINVIGEQYGNIQQTLNDHTKTLASHTEMIGNLAIQMEIIKEEVQMISGGLKKKVDQDEFHALMRRVSMLEKRVLK